MKNFKFIETGIKDLKLIEPFIASDERGYFMKFYEKSIYEANGIFLNNYEENQSYSTKGVLRGLHFQTENAQSKLVRAIRGCVYDVVVDLRIDSNTFGQWKGFWLSEENKNMLYVPKNFAHGFLTLSEDAIVSYICDDKYMPEYDSGIIWSDNTLNVAWPSMDQIIVSDKDSNLITFNEYAKVVKNG